MFSRCIYIIILVTTGCQMFQSNITFDANKLSSWSQEKRDKEECKDDPFLVIYSKDNKTLYYMAVDHSLGPPENNKTFQMIEKTINKYRPEIVLIEGRAGMKGALSSNILTDAKLCLADNFKNCSEELYTVYIADNAGLPVTGVEPPFKDLVSALAPRYTAVDILGVYWISLLSKVQKNNPEKLRVEDIEGIINHQKTRFGQHITFDKFKEWYEPMFLKPFNFSTMDYQEMAPSPSGTPIQKYTDYFSIHGRDPYMLNKISKEFLKNDKVLIVIGSGHYIIQKQALDEAFPNKKYVCSKSEL